MSIDRSRLQWTRGVALLALTLTLGLSSAAAAPEGPVLLDQGPQWGSAARADYYSLDQGAQLIPLRWIAALDQPGGEPFMADSLSRYGYLANELGDIPGVPLGFSVASSDLGPMLGLTCAACHTRQIEVDGKAYRVDGGPALADFQRFLEDLDAAVGAVLKKEANFERFAARILGPGAAADVKAKLHGDLSYWYLRNHALFKRALPDPAWGPGRLDAVAMIYNRLAGLDIGPPPTYVIAENIQPADAPVRYPFLWNAARQDMTQWPGFAQNGNALLALARNLGEVYGVFATFHPRKNPARPLGVDYLTKNSANFDGLNALEDLIWKIDPPKWPWGVDETLADKGREIYYRDTDNGGCVECHGIREGAFRSFKHKTWATPVLDVGTDSREYAVMMRTVKTGSLEGASIIGMKEPLKAEDAAINVLGVAVLGSILQHYTPLLRFDGIAKDVPPEQLKEMALQKVESLQGPLREKVADLNGAFLQRHVPADQPQGEAAATPESGPYKYESRVLEGIWAAAPYLHNGSVPTLAELLKPAAERVESFKVGPAYDIEKLGLAVEQPGVEQTLVTTGCDQRDSGNSRCGHEFGTDLSEDEKKALLEYLKIL